MKHKQPGLCDGLGEPNRRLVSPARPHTTLTELTERNEGFCSAAFGAAMEQCKDSVYFTECSLDLMGRSFFGSSAFSQARLPAL